jgi:hypothetical protein
MPRPARSDFSPIDLPDGQIEPVKTLASALNFSRAELIRPRLPTIRVG